MNNVICCSDLPITSHHDEWFFTRATSSENKNRHASPYNKNQTVPGFVLQLLPDAAVLGRVGSAWKLRAHVRGRLILALRHHLLFVDSPKASDVNDLGIQYLTLIPELEPTWLLCVLWVPSRVCVSTCIYVYEMTWMAPAVHCCLQEKKLKFILLTVW